MTYPTPASSSWLTSSGTARGLVLAACDGSALAAFQQPQRSAHEPSFTSLRPCLSSASTRLFLDLARVRTTRARSEARAVLLADLNAAHAGSAAGHTRLASPACTPCRWMRHHRRPGHQRAAASGSRRAAATRTTRCPAGAARTAAVPARLAAGRAAFIPALAALAAFTAARRSASCPILARDAVTVRGALEALTAATTALARRDAEATLAELGLRTDDARTRVDGSARADISSPIGQSTPPSVHAIATAADKTRIASDARAKRIDTSGPPRYVKRPFGHTNSP